MIRTLMQRRPPRVQRQGRGVDLTCSSFLRRPPEELVFFRDAAELFCEEATAQVTAMRSAIISRDGDGLARAAREFGALLALLLLLGPIEIGGADRLISDIERLAERREFSRAGYAIYLLWGEVTRVRAVLAAVRAALDTLRASRPSGHLRPRRPLPRLVASAPAPSPA